MPYKVAVGSSDGKFVNQHFGRAKQFLVFEIDANGDYVFVALRDNEPPCSGGEHHDNLLNRSIDLISDCRVVVVSQIGQGAVEALIARGVTPYVYPDFIEDALKSLISLENITRAGREEDVQKD